MPPPMKQAFKAKNFKKSIKQLLGSLKTYAWQLISGLCCAAISTILGIIGPNQIQKIASYIVKEPVEMLAITKLGIGLIIIYVSSFAFSFIQNFLMSGVTARMSKDFRGKISHKINNLPQIGRAHV